MSEFKDKYVINIDLAISSKKSTEWTVLKNKSMKNQILHFRRIKS
jgi:hypothetical protein